MDIAGFAKVAPYLTHPLVLVGFVLMLAYAMHWQLMKSGLLRQVNQKDSGVIIRLFLRYGFWLALMLLLAGVGLSAWNSWMEKEKVGNLEQLSEKVAAKVVEKMSPTEPGRQEAIAEAITALSKIDAPAKSINAALQELEQGRTEQAQVIFAEELRTKEAEGGQKANKEAAAAARHLGALAFMGNTKKAVAAYQKAVALDSDNAEGWNQLGHLLQRTGELARAEEAYRKVLALGETKQDRTLQAAAYGNLGIVYTIRGELDQAEQMHKISLAINESLGSKVGIAQNYCNLGIVYKTRGNLDQAEDMYRKALAINEALGSKEGMERDYTNLGVVYATRGELNQAEQMFRKSLKINETLGSKVGMARDYCNLGRVAYTRGDLTQTEQMHNKALEINKALGNKEGMERDYTNLGIVYDTRGELDKAEEMYRKSFENSEALGRKEGMANQYGNLGTVYKKRGNLDQAEELWKKSLSLFQEMGHRNAKVIQQGLDELAQQRSPSH